MSDTKFTPGPWIANRRYIGVPKHKSFIGEMRDHNGNWRDSDQSIANAHLIAAAPDLYEALQGTVRILDALLSEGFTGYVEDSRKVKAALAKARGEQKQDKSQ